VTTKHEKIQMWVAAFLTAGEWAIALIVLIHRGDFVMIYLAVTYMIRETSGGKHHHEVLMELYRRLTIKV